MYDYIDGLGQHYEEHVKIMLLEDDLKKRQL